MLKCLNLQASLLKPLTGTTVPFGHVVLTADRLLACTARPVAAWLLEHRDDHARITAEPTAPPIPWMKRAAIRTG